MSCPLYSTFGFNFFSRSELGRLQRDIGAQDIGHGVASLAAFQVKDERARRVLFEGCPEKGLRRVVDVRIAAVRYDADDLERSRGRGLFVREAASARNDKAPSSSRSARMKRRSEGPANEASRIAPSWTT